MKCYFTLKPSQRNSKVDEYNKVVQTRSLKVKSVVGERVDDIAGDDGLNRIANGLGDVFNVGDAVDLGDNVAALSDARLVDSDGAVDAVLGGHLLAGLN